MGKLTWLEIVGLADEVADAVAAVRAVVDVARAAADGRVTPREIERIEAHGRRAVKAIEALISEIKIQAAD